MPAIVPPRSNQTWQNCKRSLTFISRQVMKKSPLWNNVIYLFIHLLFIENIVFQFEIVTNLTEADFLEVT